MVKLRVLTLVCLAVLCLGYQAKAQIENGAFGYYADALRFSSLSGNTGTARMQALGGANAALGGDITSATSNPAGLGYFNRSVAVFTPAMNFNTSEATFSGETNSGFINDFNFNTLGVGFNFSKGDIVQEKFKGGTFAINFQRINDFHNEFAYEGYNDDNSIIDYFLQQADGVAISDIDYRGLTSLAYYNYLINPVQDQNGLYSSFVPGFPRQRETVKTTGGQNQWSFSYGGNYDDKLYFGAGIGLVSLKYVNTKNYTEDSFYDFAQDAPDPTINYLNAEERLEIIGSGVNATLGFIYRPMDLVRVGVSYRTPTIYDISEESTSSLTTVYKDYYYEAEDTTLTTLSSLGEILESTYQMSTPGRLSAGVAIFAGKNGFVSADVEFVNYGRARMRSSDFSVSADNRTIENLYRSTLNYRLGAEGRFDIFRVRGGYVLYGDPYSDSDFSSGSSQAISGGVGVMLSSFFIDFGLVTRLTEQTYSPYVLSAGNSPQVDIKNRATSGLISVGFSF